MKASSFSLRSAIIWAAREPTQARVRVERVERWIGFGRLCGLLKHADGEHDLADRVVAQVGDCLVDFRDLPPVLKGR